MPWIDWAAFSTMFSSTLGVIAGVILLVAFMFFIVFLDDLIRNMEY